MDDVTPEGAQLIKGWLQAQTREKDARSALNSAECATANARNALAKWLLPEDAKVGEKISVWMGDSLFQAERQETGDPIVSVRTRGKFVINNSR